MNTSKEYAVDLGKEFWGILLFELSLPALYELLELQKVSIGLFRFSDWVLFPEKIPFHMMESFINILNRRSDNSKYISLQNRKLNASEENTHQLMMEMLRLKYGGDQIDPDTFHAIYRVKPHVFFALTLQLVENGYLSANKVMFEFYHLIREGSHFNEVSEG